MLNTFYINSRSACGRLSAYKQRSQASARLSWILFIVYHCWQKVYAAADSLQCAHSHPFFIQFFTCYIINLYSRRSMALTNFKRNFKFSNSKFYFKLINGVIQAKYNLLCEKLNVSTSKEEMRVKKINF